MWLGNVYIEPEMARLALLANSIRLPRPRPHRRSAPLFLTPLPANSTRVTFDDPSIEAEFKEN